jgi:N-acylneuraminate cytidylyltransferase/CMP-N,N'-diacetyllegionaminic acid synthase
MLKKELVIALIPARGGSKRLPKKNIRPLLGKPLIVWTIEHARASRYIDRVIVSTDDEEIAKIAQKHGAEVPFMRPKELATDEAKGIDVVLHAIEFLDKQLGKDFVLVCLQPTSPLRTSEDIDKALEEFLKNPKAEAIVSVCECEHHPLWSGVLPEDRNMKNFLKPDIINKNSQELPKYYRLNGAIYIGRASYLRKNKSFFGEKTYAYVMPSFRSVDIDTILDFKFAEFLLREVLENKEVK